jgi:hypothetical protein
LFDYVNRQKNYKADRRSAANLSLNRSRGAPGCHVTDPQAAPQGGLADEQDGQRRAGIKVAVREHPDRFQLLVGEQV